MKELYPLKFKPILKDKIWGGSKIKHLLKKSEASDQCGESWEISGLRDNVSIVKEGFLKGNELTELIEVYMGDLVGDQVFETFGLEFPLLIKFIDAAERLSIQVHPDDKIALERHESFGKTEMWYIIQSDPGAELISGFKTPLDEKSCLSLLKTGEFENALNYEPVAPGDVYFIPAGRIHALGAGILLTEIQQSSDITYRIYDFNRTDENGKFRDLHILEALDAIDFRVSDNIKTHYPYINNQTVNTIRNRYFITNVIHLNRDVEKDYNFIDSFVIYICTEGKGTLEYNGNGKTRFKIGETLLIPASLKSLVIKPEIQSTLLEVYIG